MFLSGSMLHLSLPDGRVLAVPWYGPTPPLARTTQESSSPEQTQNQASTQSTLLDTSSDPEGVFSGFFLTQAVQRLRGLELLPAPLHPAEEIAYRALLSGEATHSVLRDWIRSVPTSSLSTRSNRVATESEPNEVKSFVSGAFVFGGVTGIHANTRQFPWSTRLLTCLVHTQVSGVTFSSVTVNLNCHTRVHRDSNNHSFVPNYIIPLSCFQAGELWLEHEQGEVELDERRGRLLPIQLPFVTFSPKIRHGTMPWTGDRLVLIAFHIRQAWRLSSDATTSLESCGFRLCVSDVEDDPYL